MDTYDLDMLNVDIDRNKKKLNKPIRNKDIKKTSNPWLLFNLLILVINIGGFVVYFYIAEKDNVINTAEKEILYLLGFVLIINLIFLFMSVISTTGSNKKIKKSSSIKELKSNIKKDIDFFYLDRSLIA